jgi:hypothetical protein
VLKKLSTIFGELYLTDRVNPTFLDRIHDGELEAIALLVTDEYIDYRFCTADALAVKAISSLGIGSLGISLEELLTQIRQNKKLPDPSYSKKVFDKNKQTGINEMHKFIKS